MAAAAAAAAREGLEVRGARSSSSGRLGLGLQLLQRPPRSGTRARSPCALYLVAPLKPARMGARLLPLLSALLLLLLAGESPENQGDPRWAWRNAGVPGTGRALKRWAGRLGRWRGSLGALGPGVGDAP